MTGSGRRQRLDRPGVTLVEALVVIGLVGMLVGLLMPAVQNARAAAARTQCQNHLHQLGVGLHAYEATNGRLPPATRGLGVDRPENLLGWMALILPQMDQSALWASTVQACRADPLPHHNPPHVGYSTAVGGYICPADGRRGVQTNPLGRTVSFSWYLGVLGAARPDEDRGVFFADPGIRLTDVLDGTANTVMVGERPPPATLDAGQWYDGAYSDRQHGYPNHYMAVPHLLNGANIEDCLNGRVVYGPGRLDNRCDRYHFWSLHSGGANWLMADGSVRFMGYGARSVLPALATRAGGEVVEVP